VPGHRAVLGLGGALGDVYPVDDGLIAAAASAMVSGQSRSPDISSSAQVISELGFQLSFSLHIETAIDGFVGHVHPWVVRVPSLQPAGNLLWRPL